MPLADQTLPTLLYVDDEVMNIYLFEKTFESEYTIISAPSGEEGLEKLEEYGEQIQAVISDMRMPNMTGVQFIEKAQQKYANIPYFILTGFDFNEEIEEAVNKKMIQQFFTKPFDAPKIKAELEKAI